LLPGKIPAVVSEARAYHYSVLASACPVSVSEYLCYAGGGAATQKLDLAGLKKLLEYLRLSESGAVIKVRRPCSVLGHAGLGCEDFAADYDQLTAFDFV
jgi:hypothetical protein